jgi:hypothetical protein
VADFTTFPRSASLLSADQETLRAALADVPYRVTPGYGMRSLKPAEWQELIAAPNDEGLYDRLLVFEPPRRGHRYVVSADVSSGVGLDRSVVDVTRVGTIKEPDEQVAQFCSDHIDPSDLAFVIDPIGRLYKGVDEMPALVAIECNGLGLSTQDMLQKHIGYSYLYVWQVLDARDLSKSYTQRIGWWTTNRSRPILLETLHHALKTVDPHTGMPDYRLNSPLTIAELRTFTSPGPLWMAEAVDGANDDCIMAAAIGLFVAQTLQHTSRETIHESRRRLSEESARLTERRRQEKNPITAQTTDVTYSELMGQPDPYDDPDWETNPHVF